MFCVHDFVLYISDVNPLMKLGDLEQVDDVVQDSASSYLMCVSESWEKQSKELTIGLVVRVFSSSSFKSDPSSDHTFECTVPNLLLNEFLSRF